MIIVHMWTDLISPDAIEAMDRLTDAMASSEYECEMEVHALADSPALQALYAAKSQGVDPLAAARAGVAAARTLTAAHRRGDNIADPAVLADLSDSLGIDRDDLVAGLADGTWLPPVTTDIEDAHRVHAAEPPFVILGGLLMAAGLKSAEEYREMVSMAGQALGEAEAKARAEINAKRTGPAR